MEDSAEKNIYRKSFNKALQFVIEDGSVKSKFISNRVFPPIPKNNTCRDAFNTVEEPESFKNELNQKFNLLKQAFFAELKLL